MNLSSLIDTFLLFLFSTVFLICTYSCFSFHDQVSSWSAQKFKKTKVGCPRPTRCLQLEIKLPFLQTKHTSPAPYCTIYTMTCRVNTFACRKTDNFSKEDLLQATFCLTLSFLTVTAGTIPDQDALDIMCDSRAYRKLVFSPRSFVQKSHNIVRRIVRNKISCT